MFDESCVFCRVVGGKAQAAMLHRDEHVVAFRDIRPMAPIHILVVPTGHLASLNEVTEADEPLLAHMLRVARELAVREHVDAKGYRIVINTGPDAGQSVSHLHLHLLAGRPMSWPPG